MSELYIIPSILHEHGVGHIPPITLEVINFLDYFVVERSRTARRFIKSVLPNLDLDLKTFVEIDKHNMEISRQEIEHLFTKGNKVGLLSESGTPCIADPGASVINMARGKGYDIKPLTGPNSIMLALMSSGMNGQQFLFHGYLPIKNHLLAAKLNRISQAILKYNQTQIFIETPYRNDNLLKSIIKNVSPELYITIASSLTGENERIQTMKISECRDIKIGKVPAIFCIGRLSLH